MNSFKRIGVMAAGNVARTFRSPGNWLWLVVAPILLSLLISAIFRHGGVEQEEVIVVDEDGTETAASLVAGLEKLGYSVLLESRDETLSRIERGDVTEALLIPEGFAATVAAGRPGLLLLHAAGGAGSELELQAKGVAQALADGAPLPEPPVVHEMPRGGPEDEQPVQVRSIYSIYLIFAFTGLLLRGSVLHKERLDGTLQRIVTTGVPFSEVVAAHIAGIFFVGIVQAAVFFALTALFGTAWWAAGWGTLLLTIGATLFVAASWAIGLSGVARSATLIQALAGGLPPLMGMLGGAFFPSEVVPLGLQQLARINPMHWVSEMLEGGYVYAGVSAQLVPLAVLLLMGVFGMVLGIQGLRRLEL